MSIKILGTGSYLPKKVVTNDNLSSSLDTNDEWIFSHTGIHSRHVAESGETTSTMAAKAAGLALESAGVSPDEIGLVLVATSTPDYNTFPSTACLVQGLLECKNAGAFDLQAACAGFVYALDMARGFVASHPESKALVIGAECLSRILDWTDRSSCILFGDGAGAVVIGAEGSAELKADSILGADGNGRHFIQRSGGTMESLPFNPETGVPMRGEPKLPVLSLQGHDVFAFAVRILAKLTNDLCAKRGETPADLDRVFSHQANGRIIESVARRMKLPLEKFYLNLATTANTSAASIPISLDEAVRKGELVDGMKIVMIGFGAGLTYAGMSVNWPEL
jgi:3-oxoacyl-[acyl-carrier-protein] synthase-3